MIFAKALIIFVVSCAAVFGAWNSFQWRDAYAEQGVARDADAATIAAQQTKIAETQGKDSNVYTSRFAAAFCSGDGQALYDSMAAGSSLKRNYDDEQAYFKQLLDAQTKAFNDQLVAAASSTTTSGATAEQFAASVKALQDAYEVKAAEAAKSFTPAALLTAEVKMPEGVTCTMTFLRSFVDREGSYNAVYLITYTDAATGKSWQNFFMFTAGNGGVESVQ